MEAIRSVDCTHGADPHAESYQPMSPYSWVKNNPLGMIDPNGRDAVTYYGKEAVEYIQDLQNQAIAAEQNSEVQSSKNSFSKGFASYRNRQRSEDTDPAEQGGLAGGCPPGVDCGWVANVARHGLNASGYVSGGLGGIQIGMLEYRQSLSVNSRIGTFPRFRIGYGNLGLATRGLGKLSTYAGAPLTTYLDYRSMQAGEIGPGRFTYRLGGTGASIFGGALIGAEIGGAYGALGGAAIGGMFWAGEQSYDGIVWFGKQLSQGMVQTENALKNGWYPGR